VIAICRIGERSNLVDDADPGFLGLDDDPFDLADSGQNPRMQRHRRFDCGLRVKLGRIGDLEQDVFHHVAAERLWQGQRSP
jgi:hypothetical protein